MRGYKDSIKIALALNKKKCHVLHQGLMMGEVVRGAKQMQPDDFYTLAKELWGDNWAVILANKFDVRPKSVRRWASGASPIPDAAIAFVQFFQQRNGGEL